MTFAIAGLSRTTWAQSQLRRVYVLPLGKQMPPGQVAMVQQALKAFYAVEVQLLPGVPLPKSAYYPARKRYRADKLLPVLEAALPPNGHRILGITHVDISTTKGKYPDWGVLGLANLSGSACVLSSFRCRRQAKDDRHATERFGKVAVHELGHTFGLPHCASPGCLMRDAGGSVLTIDDESDLCARCRLTLQQRGYGLVKGAAAPW